MRTESHVEVATGYPRMPWLAAVLAFLIGPFGVIYTTVIGSIGIYLFMLFILISGLGLEFVSRVWPQMGLNLLVSFAIYRYTLYRFKMHTTSRWGNFDRPNWKKGTLVTLIGIVTLYSCVQYIRGYTRLNSYSMVPSIMNGERVNLDILPLLRGPIIRGTIVRYLIPAQYGKNALISRVVALAGDTVEMKRGLVYVNGKAADNPARTALLEAARCIDPHGPESNLAQMGIGNQQEAIKITVPDGSVYVVADNRAEPFQDSRFFGPLDVKRISGVVHLHSPSASPLRHSDCVHPPGIGY